MNAQKSPNQLCIVINDSSPAERKEWLMRAMASALRWYAQLPHKRKGDEEHAVVITDLLQTCIGCNKVGCKD